jgi:predicted dehydrogenase
MLVVAKENNRYIMDGTMFIHNNRTNLMLEYIAQSDVFGNITRINSEFTFVGDDHFHTNNIRTTKKGDPHGCLGDLGWYCIRLAQLVFSKTKAGNAKRVQTTNWKLNDEGVPIDATCLVFFQDGDGKKNSNDEHVLSFHCSFLHPLNQRVLINGTKQSLEMKDFVIPKEGVQSWVVHGQPSFGYDSYSVQISDLLESPSGPAQEVLMWRNFSNFCRTVETKGWDDAGVVSMSNISVENQQILDALMESITLGGKSVSL